jgi:hypothetical protein
VSVPELRNVVKDLTPDRRERNDMSDPNAQYNRGFQGQAPPAGGTDLDEWAKGDATRKLNQNRLGQQASGTSSDDAQSAPSHYTTPPDPRTLSIGLFLAGSMAQRSAVKLLDERPIQATLLIAARDS